MNCLPSCIHFCSKAARAKCALLGLDRETTCIANQALAQPTRSRIESSAYRVTVARLFGGDRTPIQVKDLQQKLQGLLHSKRSPLAGLQPHYPACQTATRHVPSLVASNLLQKPPAPLKVGMPDSAEVPAPAEASYVCSETIVFGESTCALS